MNLFRILIFNEESTVVEVVVPLIIIKSKASCAVETSCGFRLCGRGRNAVVACEAPTLEFFKVWWMEESSDAICIPRICCIRIEKADSIASGAHQGKLIVSACGCRALDWGNGIIEVELFNRKNNIASTPNVALLDSADIVYKGARARAELYCDSGIRLAVTDERSRAQTCFYLGQGNNGKLDKYDTGSRRLLTVRFWGGADSLSCDTQHLLILDENANSMLDIEGDIANIIAGYPTAVKRLDTVRGHERHARYEYASGAFTLKENEVVLSEDAGAAPSDSPARALCIVEAVGLGRYDEARAYMSGELSNGLDDNDIKSFFGSFEKAALLPCAEGLLMKDDYNEGTGEQTITVGVISKDDMSLQEQNRFSEHKAICPRLYRITMRQGMAYDIEQQEE